MPSFQAVVGGVDSGFSRGDFARCVCRPHKEVWFMRPTRGPKSYLYSPRRNLLARLHYSPHTNSSPIMRGPGAPHTDTRPGAPLQYHNTARNQTVPGSSAPRLTPEAQHQRTSCPLAPSPRLPKMQKGSHSISHKHEAPNVGAVPVAQHCAQSGSPTTRHFACLLPIEARTLNTCMR